MSYILVQTEARIFLSTCGVHEMPFGYPFDISIVRIH
mgnify:CR=1 FL=1